MTISSLPRLLAVSGSLRKHSLNTGVLEARAELAGTTAQVVVYRGLGELPHFNPDLDTDTPPAPVVSWRMRLRQPRACSSVR